jgi:3'-phosphoadenosine 5'-phosphosulfate sulfotransferase (PAPS reductase)/FAD synthetase
MTPHEHLPQPGPVLAVPDMVRRGDLTCVVSVSGGKDSTAVALALREAGVPFRMVFADTGWEAPETYAHMDYLRAKLGTIDVVGVPGGMVERIRHRAGFPARMQRWCTHELKIEPLRAYHDALEQRESVETCCVMGVRADESPARAQLVPFYDEPSGERSWGGWVWRPILHWSIADVLAIHHRHGIQVNPLYRLGHGRVGCWPCIFANKEQVRLLAEHAPERVALIRELEFEVIQIRAKRNSEKPGRYKHAGGSFFQSNAGRAGFTPIDDVVAWSRTTRGGKQYPLLQPAPSGGCMLWGACDPPSEPTP